MKKTLFLITVLLLFLIFLQPVIAQGSIMGNIYSTDILTFVNSKPIDGYNIGGRTVVIAEDLNGYGFNVEYDDESRILKIASYFNKGFKDIKEIPRGSVGKIIGNIYKTDIKVYYNGILIEGYNIGGRTAICLEDLGDLTDSPNADYGYSEYLGKAVWDDENRTISYESYIRNESEILGISRVYHRFKDNVIYTFSDDFYLKSEFSALEDGEFTGMYTYSTGIGASKYLIKPLYFDNHSELVEIGLCVVNPNHSQNEALIYIENPDWVRDMIKSYKTPKRNHDETVAYFTEICDNVEKIENDNYTVLKANHKKEGLLFVYINKQGGFVVEDFFSSFGLNNGEFEIKMWFEENPENSGPNTVTHSVYPFGGPHGTTTMAFSMDLDTLDYE